MCSGKSTIADFFRQLGCKIISADELTKIVLREQEIVLQIEKYFGKEVLEEGKISFSKLAQQSFANSQNLAQLGNIMHPRIFQKFSQVLAIFKKKYPNKIVIYDAPLLLETEVYKKMDKTILVVTNYAITLQRWRQKIQQGNTHFQELDLQERIQYQIDPNEAKKLVDFIIDGNQNISGIQKQTKYIYEKFLVRL